MIFSGIITTTLGKTATFTMGAGRERRVHHSKSLPLLSIGERLFFGCGLAVPGVAKSAKKCPQTIELSSVFPRTSARAARLVPGRPTTRAATPDAGARSAS
jgi:hypothetical protein